MIDLQNWFLIKNINFSSSIQKINQMVSEIQFIK